jgi:hypothetical protein
MQVFRLPVHHALDRSGRYIVPGLTYERARGLPLMPRSTALFRAKLCAAAAWRDPRSSGENQTLGSRAKGSKGRIAGLKGSPRQGPESAPWPSFLCERGVDFPEAEVSVPPKRKLPTSVDVRPLTPR